MSCAESPDDRLRKLGIVAIHQDINYLGEELKNMALITASDSPEMYLHIGSGGGSAFEMLAVIRAIQVAQGKGKRVVGEVYGHAQSAAFIVLQYCTERVMGRNDVLMAHGVQTWMQGDIKDFEAERRLLEYWRHQFARHIAARAKGEYADEGYWVGILESATPNYYWAEDALEMGLVDKVEEELGDNLL